MKHRKNNPDKQAGQVGVKRPCCAACARAAKPAGFLYSKPGEARPGLNADGEPGTVEKPCKPCSQ